MLKIKDGLSLAAVAATAFTLALQPASAATISEFDAASREHQNEFLGVKTSQLYQYYQSQPGLEHMAVCMDNLEARSQSSTSAESSLIDLILDEIDLARERGENHHVEDIIYGVVEYECSKPENQIAAVDTAPAPVNPG